MKRKPPLGFKQKFLRKYNKPNRQVRPNSVESPNKQDFKDDEVSVVI